MDALEQIAAAVLYEGYLLWPYRRSARKNQQRWTFGGVYPRAFCEATRSGDAWCTQAQCLVQGKGEGEREAAGDHPRVDVELRFLHLVRRQLLQRQPDGALQPVDALQVGEERLLTWEEATERRIPLAGLTLADLLAPRVCQSEIHVPASTVQEPVLAPDGTGAVLGAVVRQWDELRGTVSVQSEALAGGLFRLTVRWDNDTPWSGEDRARTQGKTFLSAHTVLRVAGGAFVSPTDPPASLRAEADACRNVGVWPVLVGTEGVRDTLLCSPIILSDYPQIAPESLGDLFDGTEVDQLLLLNTLTLTDEEKAEVRATDPRAREILDRAEALTGDDLARMHGAIRDFQVLRPPSDAASEADADARLWQLEMGRPQPRSVLVQGRELTPGTLVRLHPRRSADIFDRALDGMRAYVEAIEQDYEDAVHLAVTLEDDPGRDLGVARLPGHRFFFSPDEVEWLADQPPAEPGR